MDDGRIPVKFEQWCLHLLFCVIFGIVFLTLLSNYEMTNNYLAIATLFNISFILLYVRRRWWKRINK